MAQHDEQTWFLDQLMKSSLFHQKVHEWGLLTVADAIDQVKGERLSWNVLADLGITSKAWDKVVHRGIKPVTVFAHPQVLMDVARATSYYRMLAMVSQKSMRHVGLPVERYETTDDKPDAATAWKMAKHLNQIISSLIEADEELDESEFAIWRGMAAGAQAQGSWQNSKGIAAEESIKNIVRSRLREKDLVQHVEDWTRLELRDGRTVVFGSEPDVGFYRSGCMQAALEIKGGIDPAGVLERLGAALKSLARIREENPTAVTVLIVTRASMTETATRDLAINRTVVTHWFTIEDLLTSDASRESLFDLLGI